MEDNKTTSYERKKSQALRFNVGGGGVLGGVVLLGGGLAVYGLMAAFSIIKNKNSKKHEHKRNEDPATAYEKKHDANEGLSFVLQNPVHQMSCCTSPGTPTIGLIEGPKDSWEFVSSHSVALGDKPLPIMDRENENPVSCDQEILFSGDSEKGKESTDPCNENEECSLPASENMMEDDSGENLRLTETTEMKIAEEPAQTEELALEENLAMQLAKEEEQEEDGDGDGDKDHVIEKEEESTESKSALKENSLMQSVEEEEEEEEGDDDDIDNEDDDSNDDHDDISEDVTEKEEDDHDDNISEDVTLKQEENSEGTGSSASSGDSNVEAIWPTEMIEALSQELKVMKTYNQNSGENVANGETYDSLNCKSNGNIFNKDGNNEINENLTTVSKATTQELVMEKRETTHLPRREVCVVWSLLVVLLLLLLLHIHRAAPDLSYQNSVHEF